VFSSGQIVVSAVVGAALSFALLLLYGRWSKDTVLPLGEAVLVALVVGLSILFWRMAGNVAPLNEDPIPPRGQSLTRRWPERAQADVAPEQMHTCAPRTSEGAGRPAARSAVAWAMPPWAMNETTIRARTTNAPAAASAMSRPALATAHAPSCRAVAANAGLTALKSGCPLETLDGTRPPLPPPNVGSPALPPASRPRIHKKR
jgi:hypothetical protein